MSSNRRLYKIISTLDIYFYLFSIKRRKNKATLSEYFKYKRKFIITSVDYNFLIDYWTKLFVSSLYSLQTDFQMQTTITYCRDSFKHFSIGYLTATSNRREACLDNLVVVFISWELQVEICYRALSKYSTQTQNPLLRTENPKPPLTKE